MTPLANHVAVRARFARSANLERDSGRAEPFDGYVVTARALDVVERITGAALSGRAGGAWSLTGPYGSGKSSLGLLLGAAFGPPTPTRKAALERIIEASPPTAEAVREVHRRRHTTRTGFHRGLVTADRKPIPHTLLRALHSAVVAKWGRIPPVRDFRASRLLKEVLRELEAPGARPNGSVSQAVVEIARVLAEQAPLLLVVDEFGKALEAIQDSADSDPYVLQQLAEAGQGAGLPIFLVTFQHLSLDDYLVGAEAGKRRDWRKVQGRFEDVAYLDSARQTRTLIGSVFAVRDQAVADQVLRKRIRRRARHYAARFRELGVADGADAETLAACYPLHPLAAMVLPDLCSRYGQHERTLFAFLAGADPASAKSFLASRNLPARGPLPSVGLDAVYDYFVGGAASSLALSQSSRWTEISTRVRDLRGLTAPQTRLAKSIALLNLVSTSGALRASREVLALTEPQAAENLAALEERGVITYRKFADEYRIWQGTDIDVRRLLAAEHERTQHKSLFEILSVADTPPLLIAARHSAQKHTFRVFSRRYAEPGETPAPLDPFSPYDGEVLLALDSEPPPLPASGPGAKPVLAAIPERVEELDRAAREVAATAAVLDDASVAADPVARAELGERLAQARAGFDRAFCVAFRSEACRWIMPTDEAGEHELAPGRRGSAPLSEAADRAYPATPVIPNEMLNRSELTSQGAKARRLLLEAMIERGAQPDLGFEGYGPEVAMYRAFLKETRLHRKGPGDEGMVFGKPTKASLEIAWKVVHQAFRRARDERLGVRDLYAELLSPPVGMKAAAIPVFLTAALLAHRGEIALYEHGTFKPVLSSALSERMVKNPGHFELKHFASTTGVRKQVVSALAERLGVRPASSRHRVAPVVSVVGHLVSMARGLDKFTLRTRDLGEAALAARTVLTTAVEPDELLFSALPAALGFPSVRAGARRYEEADRYAQAVAQVFRELRGRSDKLLSTLLKLMLDVSDEPSRLAVAGQAAALDGQVLDPEVRAFVLTLANDGAETDHDWIRAIATVVAKKAPSEWADEDVAHFRRELRPRVAAFHRLVALHADNRAAGGGPFAALRVTLTRSDGSEHVRLVAIDDNERPAAEETLDLALGGLEGITGSPHRAHNALLALLGERLLPTEPERAEAQLPRLRKGAAHG